MSIRKSKVFAVAAAACVLGMMLGGCGSSTSGNATEGSNVITAFDSEPQNGLIPGILAPLIYDEIGINLCTTFAVGE